jgi:hypothetical protein
MKLSKSLIILAAVTLGVLTIASAKLMAAPTRDPGPVGTPCRTPPNQC